MTQITRTHKIAVIAGGGAMPELIINALKRDKANFITLALSGYADEAQLTKLVDYRLIHLGKIGKTLNLLKQSEVKRIVFAGNVKRPSLLSLKLDSTALKILAKMGVSKLLGGDDGLMRIIVSLLTKEGFEVCSPESIAPDMLVGRGVISKAAPSERDSHDIEVGKKTLLALGDMDVGQSVVVENGCVLGIEAAEGTDQLILRCGKLKREPAGVGVLVKMKKLGQERRIDLPAIGATTIQNLHDAGFSGLALEANSSIIINKKAVASLADKLKVFVVGV